MSLTRLCYQLYRCCGVNRSALLPSPAHVYLQPRHFLENNIDNQRSLPGRGVFVSQHTFQLAEKLFSPRGVWMELQSTRLYSNAVESRRFLDCLRSYPFVLTGNAPRVNQCAAYLISSRQTGSRASPQTAACFFKLITTTATVSSAP
jgi:hypothetical protein